MVIYDDYSEIYTVHNYEHDLYIMNGFITIKDSVPIHSPSHRGLRADFRLREELRHEAQEPQPHEDGHVEETIPWGKETNGKISLLYLDNVI